MSITSSQVQSSDQQSERWQRLGGFRAASCPHEAGAVHGAPCPPLLPLVVSTPLSRRRCSGSSAIEAFPFTVGKSFWASRRFWPRSDPKVGSEAEPKPDGPLEASPPVASALLVPAPEGEGPPQAEQGGCRNRGGPGAR